VLTDGPRPGDGRAHPSKNPFIKGFTLTAQERQDLLDFLSSLTDEHFLTNPQFAAPNARSPAE
jgi:cytochrome c peroxidase